MDDAAALLAQFEQINQGFFVSEGVAQEDGSTSESAADDENDALESAILQNTLITTASADRAWQICTREGVGRYLVATHDLPAEAIVFSERPLIVAEEAIDLPEESPLRSEMAQVAVRLQEMPASGPAALLQEPVLPPGSASKDSLYEWSADLLQASRAAGYKRADGSEPTLQSTLWALGVSTTNVHHRSKPNRGCLGLLSSMMEHSCQPSAVVDIGPIDDGSILTLRTKRRVHAGESLSISYVEFGTPVAERRRALLFQHGFLCECARCVLELAITAQAEGKDAMEDEPAEAAKIEEGAEAAAAEQVAAEAEQVAAEAEQVAAEAEQVAVEASKPVAAGGEELELDISPNDHASEQAIRMQRRLERRLRKTAHLPSPIILRGLLEEADMSAIWTFANQMREGGDGWTRYGSSHTALFLHYGAPAGSSAATRRSRRSESESSCITKGEHCGAAPELERTPFAAAQPELLARLLSRVREESHVHGLCPMHLALSVRCIEVRMTPRHEQHPMACYRNQDCSCRCADSLSLSLSLLEHI